MSQSSFQQIERWIALLRDILLRPIVETQSHQRSVYIPLHIVHQIHESSVSPDLSDVQLPSALFPRRASQGDVIATGAWFAYAKHLAAIKNPIKEASQTSSSEMFDELIQYTGRHFLVPSPSDNPEPWWFHELAILHAVQSYACYIEPTPGILKVLNAATLFHQEETQPDHATTEPWAIHAFAINSDTTLLAEQMLHSAMTQSHGLTPPTYYLLQDALVSLEALLRKL